VNRHLLHEASRWYLNGLRSGTAKTKERAKSAAQPQALAAKGHGTRAVWLDPFALLAPWRTVHGLVALV